MQALPLAQVPRLQSRGPLPRAHCCQKRQFPGHNHPGLASSSSSLARSALVLALSGVLGEAAALSTAPVFPHCSWGTQPGPVCAVLVCHESGPCLILNTAVSLWAAPLGRSVPADFLSTRSPGSSRQVGSALLSRGTCGPSGQALIAQGFQR